MVFLGKFIDFFDWRREFMGTSGEWRRKNLRFINHHVNLLVKHVETIPAWTRSVGFGFGVAFSVKNTDSVSLFLRGPIIRTDQRTFNDHGSCTLVGGRRGVTYFTFTFMLYLSPFICAKLEEEGVRSLFRLSRWFRTIRKTFWLC